MGLAGAPATRATWVTLPAAMGATEPAEHTYARLKRAIAGEPLPTAVVDLDAFDANAARLFEPVRASGKTLRIATKSLRCLSLVRRVLAAHAPVARGLMTYTATETAFLAGEGFDDLLLAYPTVQARDTALLAELAKRGANVATVVDDVEHLEALDAAGRAAGARVRVVVEADLAYRAAGGLVHLGVRRSPLHTPEDVVAFAEKVAAFASLELHGVMGYESQIAGSTDANPFTRWMNPPKRAVKLASRARVARARERIAAMLAERGRPAVVFNGGGTGSVGWSSAESALTEVTAGSGFVDAHLFDYYKDLSLTPAAYFALQVVRRPGPGMVACHGGGYIASGEVGLDRQPLPALPAGLRLVGFEGAGEVQTPLVVPSGVALALGDPVFFRHAKAGELAEHFHEYLLVRGDAIEERAPTYRGMGRCFLG